MELGIEQVVTHEIGHQFDLPDRHHGGVLTRILHCTKDECLMLAATPMPVERQRTLCDSCAINLKNRKP